MPKLRMVQCATLVNKSAVRRESKNGVEHVVISSFTLPDNVVMNGILYPAEEISKSFKTLERTLAPVEHPSDQDGNFISASDPEAIHNFHAGAFNVNVEQRDGRVHIEKFINVQEALKTERGKRLMDRIEELETNDSPRPIHTSVGVFLEVEELDSPETNFASDEYSLVARNMLFDHDAILLDSVGAAQPSQGVGMAVNLDGDQLEVDRFLLDTEETDKKDIKANDFRTNAEGPSFNDIVEQLNQAITGIVTYKWIFVAELYNDEVIFETNDGLFSVQWSLSDGQARLTGIPIRVDRLVSYQPKVNSKAGGESKMKELILNALAEAGITTDGLSDEQLFAEYNALQTNSSDGAGDGEGADGAGETGDMIANAISTALQPLTDKVDGLASQVNANADKEIDDLANVIVNSGKFSGLDLEGAKKLPLESLQSMAANCGVAVGIPLTPNSEDGDDFGVPTDMPE